MNTNQALEKLRFFLADPLQKIWQDIELKSLLNDAVKQYCIDSCALTGTFDLVPDADGNYIYPDDFAGFIIGWNEHGSEIAATTSTELFQKQRLDGNFSAPVRYIYEDLAGKGGYDIYPLPEDNQDVTVYTFLPDWGEILSDGFGVFSTDGYGTTLSVAEYRFAGDCVYSRIGKIEEIQDYMAVIYYAMYLAYSNMSDFGNAERADIYLQRYKYRVNSFCKVKYSARGVISKANYY